MNRTLYHTVQKLKSKLTQQNLKDTHFVLRNLLFICSFNPLHNESRKKRVLASYNGLSSVRYFKSNEISFPVIEHYEFIFVKCLRNNSINMYYIHWAFIGFILVIHFYDHKKS